MTHNISIDTQNPPGDALFEVTNGETPGLDVTLLNGGMPYDLTGRTIKAVFTKPDGTTAVQENAKGIQDNKFHMDILPASFSPGMMLCEVQVWYTPEPVEEEEPQEGEETPTVEPAPVMEANVSFRFICYKAKVKKRFAISLDAKRSTGNREFEVVDGDNGNVLVVTLTDDGVPVDLTGCFVMAVFSKPNGRTAEQDTRGNGVSIGGAKQNELEIELYISSTSPGLVECEILVFSGEQQDTLITSARFNFTCRRGIVNSNTVSETSEWPLLTELLHTVEQGEETRGASEGIRQANEDDRVQRDRAFSVWEQYDPNRQYTPLNKVAYHGSSYMCIADTQGNAPPDAAYWLLIAAKGRDGDGSGDMVKDVYDIRDSGVVDDAQRLGGKLPGAYALVSVQRELTLEPAAWEDGVLRITDTAIRANSRGDLMIAQSATKEEYAAWSAAQPQVTAQAEGALTLTARGTVPTISIPIILEVRS